MAKESATNEALKYLKVITVGFTLNLQFSLQWLYDVLK